MAANKSASLEARIKNSRELAITIREYTLYEPTSDDIKKNNYETFVETVDSSLVPFRNSTGALATVRKSNVILINRMVKISKAVRSEIAELRGRKSDEYKLVSNIVKSITGQNISEHSRTKKKISSSHKEGDPEVTSISVSKLDNKSKLGNFRELTGLLTNWDFYNPADFTITIQALQTLENEVTQSLDELAFKNAENVNERSKVQHYFDGNGGLRDRASRARMHVRRKYGKDSPEYKALINKVY